MQVTVLAVLPIFVAEKKFCWLCFQIWKQRNFLLAVLPILEAAKKVVLAVLPIWKQQEAGSRFKSAS